MNMSDARLDDFFDRQRAVLPDFEIRVWVAPERWDPIGYAHNRQFACILAEALWHSTAQPVQVWQIRNCLHLDFGSRQLMDVFPPTSMRD